MENIIRSNNMWVDTSFEDVSGLSPQYSSVRPWSCGTGHSEEEGFFRTPPSASSRHRRMASYDTDNELVNSPRRYQRSDSKSPCSSKRSLTLSKSLSGSKSLFSSRSTTDESKSPKTPQNVLDCLNWDGEEGFPHSEVIDSPHSPEKGNTKPKDRDSGKTADSGRDSGRDSASRSRASRESSGTGSDAGSGRRSRRSTKSNTSSEDERLARKNRSWNKNNGLPSRDETIYLQTFYKVMTSFNTKQKNALTLPDSGSYAEPTYRKVVFEIIQKLNKDARKCTLTQQDLVLQSVTFICKDTTPDTEVALEGAVDDILTFFLTTFYTMLSSRVMRQLEKIEVENLKTIIELVGVLGCKSEYFRKKLEKRQIFRRFTDKIMTRASSAISTQSVEDDRENLVDSIVDIALKSQILFELLVDVRTVLLSIQEILEDSVQKEDSEALLVITQHLSRVQDTPNSLLFNSRTSIRSLIGQFEFCTEDKMQFIDSRLICQLAKRCLITDLTCCSHLLKLFLILGEQPLLQQVMTIEYCSELVTVFLATMRCEENSLEDSLMKFWLAQRMCADPLSRNLLFRSEGVMLGIMALMRSVNMEANDGLAMLSPFYKDVFFLDLSLTTAQMIQFFGSCFQTGESSLLRRQAGNLLQLYAEGLITTNHVSQLAISLSISNSFIDSGLVFSLLNVISAEECDPDWLDMGTKLLCVLVADTAICDVFLMEPLGVLHCLVTSVDSYQGRRTVFTSLIAVLEVVVKDVTSHPRLFESDIIIDLAEHIRDTLSTGAVSAVTKGVNVLHTLHIFDLMTALSPESCQTFKQMELEVFMSLLLQHDRKPVRDMVSRILERLGPTQWKKLFHKAKKMF